MSEGGIAANLERVRARVEAACLAAGREPSGVRLLAASKTQPASAVREAFDAGQVLFGESRAQELRDKYDELGRGPEWHFIGHLQSNKVKYVVGRATLLHTLHSLPLAREVSERLGARTLGVLVEVNIAGEESKQGVAPDAALDLCAQVAELPGLRLRGLMCMPPWGRDPTRWFEQLAALATRGKEQGLALDELSMGMSDDLEQAIACGSTIVRVGTAIFGGRG